MSKEETFKKWLSNYTPKTLTNNNFSVKQLYNLDGKKRIYFFLRELKQDHYFIIEDTLYLLKYDSSHYNPETSRLGKFADSFRLVFENNSNIEKLITLKNAEIDLKNEKKEKGGDYEIVKTAVATDKEEIKNKINNKLAEITILLTKL
jgi:hypothetical protein